MWFQPHSILTVGRFGNYIKVFIKPYLGSTFGQPSQQIIHCEKESIFVKSKVYVMEEFGCIHFKNKKQVSQLFQIDSLASMKTFVELLKLK